jgi:hypothetical protein
MDDYIFLIIAIALSIFGAINQNKKKKQAENPFEEVDAKPRNFFMDQLLGKDFLDESEPEVKKVAPIRVNPAPTKVAVVKSSNNIQTTGNFHLQKFKSTLPDRPKHVTISTTQRIKEEVEIVEPEETTNYLEDFSLRKAFVYSQILEQKY